MSVKLGRLARALGLGVIDLIRGSEKKRQELEDHSKAIRFYQRMTLDLAVARDNVEFVVYGDVIAVERTTGTLDVRLNEIEADHIELNRVRKVYSEFWRFYITNPAQVGLEAVILIGRDAVFDAETVRAVGLIDTLGGDINPATEDKQDTLIALQRADTPAIYHVVMTNLDAEYSQALPAGTKRFTVQMRENDTAFRLAYVTGKVATPVEPYYTVQAAKEYYEDKVELTGVTVYFACAVALKNIEIMAWN